MTLVINRAGAWTLGWVRSALPMGEVRALSGFAGQVWSEA